MKAFGYHLPFGAEKTCGEQIEQLSHEGLAHLIKICGFLKQTKVYLYWQKEALVQHNVYIVDYLNSTT